MKREFKAYFNQVRKIYDEYAHDSQFDFTLRKPATEVMLTKARKRLGVPINRQLKSLWSIANGSDRAPVLCDGTSFALLSIEDAFRNRSYFECRAPQYDGNIESDEPRDPRVGEGWFSPGWLPFASLEGGSVQLLVDHRPLGTGKSGQIICYTHDPDEMDYIADSIAALLPRSLKAIQYDPLEFLWIF